MTAVGGIFRKLLLSYKPPLPLPFQPGKKSPCFDCVQFNLVWPLQGVVVWVCRWLMVSVFFFLVSHHQYPVQLHACSGGAALPLLLAAHLHPCAARVHVGYCLLSHSLPGRAAVKFFAEAQGVTCGRGEMRLFRLSLRIFFFFPDCKFYISY